MKHICLFITALALGSAARQTLQAVDSASDVRFRKLVLTEEFHGEGAAVGDIDGDGHADVVSGPYWYPGPGYRQRHEYTAAIRPQIAGYSDHFLSWTDDFNGDGHIDILVVGFPGQAAVWYENPGSRLSDPASRDQHWQRHVAWPTVDGESPGFRDLTGDGRRELICMSEGVIGYATPDPEAPAAPWSFTAVTPQRGYGRFTHGLGVGDVNGDGRADILETNGWWEQPVEAGKLFTFHATQFAQAGGAQMFAYDFDGDGDQDVVSVQNAHGWGLTWFEQRGEGDNRLFLRHPILAETPAGDPAGLELSQMHSLALVDIDGDGVRDLVTGKRFWAHNGHDPGATQLPLLVWFRTVRSPPRVDFEPHLIDLRSGVGTQLTVEDATGDGKPDILVGNKLGTFLLAQDADSSAPPELAIQAVETKRLLQAGTELFRTHIRQTEPLSPAEEKATFVLPDGFVAELFAAEPDIAKPINMAFDERGRLWISNTVEYPYPAPEDRPGRDSIKVLEDRDGDGRADRITTFADGLNVPIGLYPYLDGVICYSIPYIWFLRDTDGDGRADQRQKLFGPFDYSRDTHGLCNAFVRGLDGWLYACHGFNNHSAVRGTDGHRIEMQSGNTFRMRLDGSRIEHVTHGQVNPFGIAIDRYGDLFTTDCHTRPIMLLLPGGYYESFGKPHDGLGFVPNVMEHMHGSTGFAGIALAESTRFPPNFESSIFIGNVITGRINRNSLQHVGSSVRAVEEADFLIPGDPWCRPVDLQVGPDGALYVADFYNRIIGHYEVPLDHPGRDRHRGRIWRITFGGADARRDVPADFPVTSSVQAVVDTTAPSPETLVRKMATGNLSAARRAADRLCDEFSASAVATVRDHLFNAASDQLRIGSLWVLHREHALASADLRRAVADPLPEFRVHAFRVIAEQSELPDQGTDWLVRGLQDEDPLVRRAAAMAATRHLDRQLVAPLMRLFHDTPADDVHLKHAIRLALQAQLRDPQTLVDVTADHDASRQPADVRLVADICLSLDSQLAADYIAHHIEQLAATGRPQLAAYLAHAATWGSPDAVGELVATARQQFSGDGGFQLELLESLRTSLAERGAEIPGSIRDWADMLAAQLLATNDGRQTPLPWTFLPHPAAPQRENAWAVSQRRDASDGQQHVALYSSFPHGERGAGIYRSASFTLGDTFAFYLAGHDGPPGEPLAGTNEVRLCLVATDEVLQRSPPPRNDTAQRVEWDTSGHVGSKAYVELVDGNTTGAFAWLAAGRFSEPRLNPSTIRRERMQAADLVEKFNLAARRTQLLELLHEPDLDPESITAYAAAILGTGPDTRLLAVARIPRIRGVTSPLIRQAIDAIVAQDPRSAEETLRPALKAATFEEQVEIAEELAGDAGGREFLFAVVASGHVSPRVLTRSTIEQRLRAVATPAQLAHLEDLVRDLPPEDSGTADLIAARVAAYRLHPGKRDSGRQLFTKHCAICHQVAGQGAQVGPNLDGIGNRGLQRVSEDLLAPSRNVDAAFRASTIVTKQGRVLTGLAKQTPAGEWMIFDAKGEKTVLPAADIEQQQISRLSPMPANLGETLTENEFSDLLDYLLSLR